MKEQVDGCGSAVVVAVTITTLNASGSAVLHSTVAATGIDGFGESLTCATVY